MTGNVTWGLIDSIMRMYSNVLRRAETDRIPTVRAVLHSGSADVQVLIRRVALRLNDSLAQGPPGLRRTNATAATTRARAPSPMAM